MDPSIEIRRLLPSQLKELSSRLENNEYWKDLMKIIPKNLDSNNFKCDISVHNQHKYHSEHFRLIENHSVKSRRTCTEILFDEWGTSGRIRPTLGHLLHLLVKAKLFKAADYVAVEILRQPKPQRPEGGPEAEITVDLEKIREQEDEMERLLDEIDYPTQAVNLIRSNSAKAASVKTPTQIPEIIVTPDVDLENNVPIFETPVVIQRERDSQHTERQVSDMIQFSSDQISNSGEGTNRPTEISTPSNYSNSSSSSYITDDTCTSTETSDSNQTSGPAFSLILGSSEPNEPAPASDSENFPAFSQITDVPPNLPDLSLLNLEDDTQSNAESPTDYSSVVPSGNSFCIPDLQALQSDTQHDLEEVEEGLSSALPDFGALNITSDGVLNITSNPSALNSTSNSSAASQSVTLNVSSRVSSNNSLRSTCSSPLPVLSLNTELPHFSYSKLVAATNNFNEERFTSENASGRFLGSGEFGSVFLALDLIDRRVAVKKLSLGGLEVVNVDDQVTKQFRNEVEVLSKYKHENLLTLLGFSCDGCTYCLLYEYIPGGALRDRLQVDENILSWKQRLNIAVGTSKAISYLHTGFSIPLIHRDIKSANILLDSKNNPKLGDFGLIKLLPNQSASVGTSVFGTSAYMPREAFGRDISVKLDTFSFGVVLLELITSLPPVDEDRDGSDLVTHISETVENDDILPVVDFKAGSWCESDVNYALGLYRISLECLKEKKNRPTMVEVKMALDELTKNVQLF
ncbi:unnamed protein product [Phaedon cochleariae]|uniref:non-specific serine/threonine protein kinase n=1 Tax=Phaedon cochleariae TaxID=80249 RepID=A0A9N9SAY2_PHACE|nr:unnamed protein product [Phaedon cochleariae]